MINRDAGSLQHYLIEISRIPLLTPPEEITLTTRLDSTESGSIAESLPRDTGCRQS